MNNIKRTSGELQNKQEKMAGRFEQSPWKGLNYYSEEDQDLFFGRDREIKEFVKFIDRDVLSILFATSGIGKTSLLRAGVLPLLRSSGKFPVVVRLLYGDGLPSPKEQLITTLIEEAKKFQVEIEGISKVDVSGMGLWEFFHSIECWSSRNDLLTPVIILDQFEEIFTLGSGEDEFIEELADLAENRIPMNIRQAVEAGEKMIDCDPHLQNYKIILALREDYVPKLDLLKSRMPSVMRNRFALQAFDQRAAFEVISRAGGEWIDDTVTAKIVEAVAGENNQGGHGKGKIEPAYLSVMCDELYRRMILRDESSITKELVSEEGKDILKDLYARSFEGLGDNVQSFIEDKLLTESGFRATLPVTDAVQKGIKQNELDILVNRRLLRFEERLGTRHVEISHDLLTGVALENRNLRKKRIQDAERENQILEYKTKLKQSRYIVLASCAAVLILLLGVLIVFNCWFLEHKTCFHSVKRVYGQPRGIGEPLSEKAVRHRQTSYEITTQGRRIWLIGPRHPKVISLRAIDSHFNLTTQHNIETYLYASWETPPDEETEQIFSGGNHKTAQRDLSEEELQSVCKWEFFSGKDGRPIYEIGKNKKAEIVWRLIYAPSGMYDWKQQAVVHYVDECGYPQRLRQDNASYVQISYNGNGLETLIEWRNWKGQRVSGRDGAHALETTYDAQGRLLSYQSMSWSENSQKYERMIDRAGNCGQHCFYNEAGWQTKAESFGVDGRPCPVKHGWVVCKQDYDSWGNLIEQSFWDEKDRPAVDLMDIHRTEYTYKSGCPIKVAYYGIDGELKAIQQGYAIVRMKYDHKGNQIEWACFNAQDQPCLDLSFGNHLNHRTFDDKGRVKDERYFGIDGQPIENKNGRYGETNEYDEYGNKSKVVFLGPDGKPRENKDGYAIVRMKYDHKGNRIEWACFNAQDQPCLDLSFGNHLNHRTFDDKGRVKDERYFGIDGQPRENKDGYAIVRMKYDHKGNQIEWACFNAQDQPCLNLSSGRHLTRKIFDDEGRVKDERYFGIGQEPCENKNGNHGFIYKYDNHGKIGEQIYLGINGKPKENEYGCAIVRMKYDNRGNQTEWACFNAHKQPCLNLTDGTHMTRKIFDQNGRVIELRNYGLQGKPIESMEGIYGGSFKYDERGNMIQVMVLGPDGKPKQIERDISTTTMKIIKGIAGISVEYDDQNRLQKATFLRPDGNPCLNAEGVSGAIITYNASGTPDKKFTDISGQECGSDTIVSVTIAPVDSPGFKKGIRSGDIILVYGRWEWSSNPLTEKDIKAFIAAGDSGMRLLRVVVYRNGEILELEFAGKMGVPVMATSISRDLFQKVKESYHRYKAQKTISKKNKG